jgi:hypothetical protein
MSDSSAVRPAPSTRTTTDNDEQWRVVHKGEAGAEQHLGGNHFGVALARAQTNASNGG